MSQLSETFPTLDCSQCIMTPRMVDVVGHPNITLHTYSELEEVDGYIGNFQVKIRKKARSVDMGKCTGCGVCMAKCPQKKIPNSFDCNLGTRPAIYVPFPQAVPNVPVIDRANCTYFKSGKCGVCAKVCGPGAVDFAQEDQVVVEQVPLAVEMGGVARRGEQPLRGHVANLDAEEVLVHGVPQQVRITSMTRRIPGVRSRQGAALQTDENVD